MIREQLAWSNTEAGSCKRTTPFSREPFRRRYRRAVLLLGASTCLIVAPFTASAQASPYVPLDDIAYSYVDALVARGFFRELPTLERPYTEGALRAAIDSARVGSPNATVSSYLNALYEAIEKYAVRPATIDSGPDLPFRVRGSGDFYATAQTSGRRELMLADDRSSVRPGATIRVVTAGGPIAGSIRPLIDTRLNADPEFAGRKDRKLAARTEDGYVSAQWKYAELFFGRVGRNWGPPTLYGLQLGNYAYTYDHLFARIGSDKAHLSSVIARLDDFQDATGATIQRYFSIHRLAVRFGNWDLAGSESYLYTGVGRGFEPSLTNPFNIYSLSWRNEKEDGNLGLGAELAYRSSRFGMLAAHLFIDDLQIDRCNPNCREPSSYGVTLSAEGLPLRGDRRWFTSYTRVSNLAYHTPVVAERYAIFNVGLGRGFSDYDEIKLGADLALVPRAPLRLYVAHRRQGEGDYRAPYPLPADYATTPGTFSGVVMGVTRVGLSGAARSRLVELSGDIGVNHVTNDAHVTGVSRTAFEGRLKIAVEPRWSVSF